MKEKTNKTNQNKTCQIQKVLKCVWIFTYVSIAHINFFECIKTNMYLEYIKDGKKTYDLTVI